MALSQAYVNEVLNHLPSTVVVDEATWPALVKAFKFEDRNLNDLVVGQMRLRQAKGGYDGLQADLSMLLTENETLRAQVLELTKQLDQVTAPVHGG